MSTPVLTPDENSRWEAWKRAQSSVHDAVEQRIERASGLSAPDFAVLTRLVEIGDGVLTQNRLASSLGWDRSRLSRQLTRMAQRGLLVSTAAADGVARRLIEATDDGRARVGLARPAHAEAVRDTLFTPVASADDFWSGVASLSPPRVP